MSKTNCIFCNTESVSGDLCSNCGFSTQDIFDTATYVTAIFEFANRTGSDNKLPSLIRFFTSYKMQQGNNPCFVVLFKKKFMNAFHQFLKNSTILYETIRNTLQKNKAITLSKTGCDESFRKAKDLDAVFVALDEHKSVLKQLVDNEFKRFEKLAKRYEWLRPSILDVEYEDLLLARSQQNADALSEKERMVKELHNCYARVCQDKRTAVQCSYRNAIRFQNGSGAKDIAKGDFYLCMSHALKCMTHFSAKLRGMAESAVKEAHDVLVGFSGNHFNMLSDEQKRQFLAFLNYIGDLIMNEIIALRQCARANRDQSITAEQRRRLEEHGEIAYLLFETATALRKRVHTLAQKICAYENGEAMLGFGETTYYYLTFKKYYNLSQLALPQSAVMTTSVRYFNSYLEHARSYPSSDYCGFTTDCIQNGFYPIVYNAFSASESEKKRQNAQAHAQSIQNAIDGSKA